MASDFKRVGVVINDVFAAARSLLDEIRTRHPQIEWVVCKMDEIDNLSPDLLKVDLALAIGGDGTLLQLVHAVAPSDIPVLGINTGHAGFLMDLEHNGALEGVAQYLRGQCHVEERTMLTMRVETGDKVVTACALNEVLLHRGTVPKVAQVQVRLDGNLLQVYQGDGLLVSTATGSTAYALSLGCPLQDPLSTQFMVQPIAPMPPNVEGVLVDGETQIELTPVSDTIPGSCVLTVDGRTLCLLETDTRVLVSRAPFNAKFLRSYPAEKRWSRLVEKLTTTKKRRF